MYFYRERKKHQVDLAGNLILSTNPDLVATASKTAGPRDAVNARFILLRDLGLLAKLWACARACAFILLAKPDYENDHRWQ